ncbi:MAG: histidinol dehydrogenase [Oscillospiraceae bacterium]|nr:histidinol dehydrogenase [Oscillospiraceae bacterium]
MRYMRVNDPSELPPLRQEEQAEGAEVTVSRIIEAVRRDGDDALRAFSAFDFPALNGMNFDRLYDEALRGAPARAIEVPRADIDAALDGLDEDFKRVLKRARDNIAAFHEHQKRGGFVCDKIDAGMVMGQRVIPLDRAAIYVPGGTAPYPSTVLMNAVPAKIAGVGELYMATPPGPDGLPSADILAAAALAGVDRVFAVGGAQAVAAFAYGTRSVPKADKITGPGNIYVQTAKRMVYGRIDIDIIAGPSDILIIADNTANPEYIAADLLSQAEHDTLSQSVLVTVSETLAERVRIEIKAQLAQLPRREIAARALAGGSAIIITDTLEHAAEISNRIAPEHLELCIEEPFALLSAIKHAGSVFLGHYTPEALGDYMAGPNHTLPTEGSARFFSPLSVDDFCKKSSFIYCRQDAFRALADDAAAVARSEGFEAHARSVTVRLTKEGGI